MPDDLRIRPYRPADRQPVRSLSNWAMADAFGTSPEAALDHDMSAVRKLHREPDNVFLVGICDDDLISIGGFAHRDATTVEVQKVRVDPAYHRSGYGQALLDAIEAAAEQQGVTSIVLHTSVQLTAAQHFYREDDYDETHRRRDRGDELIFYEKQL